MKRLPTIDTRSVDELLREVVGLNVQHLEEPERKRRIAAAMERDGFKDDAGYARFLRASREHRLSLASEMSVAETYFFRDPDQLKLLTDDILPRLLVTRPRDHILKIWSAGCASGEEAYTLAMLLDERGLLKRAQIVGTDITEASLSRARAGRYGAWSLRATPQLASQRYFKRTGRSFELAPELRAHVRFERQSLTELDAPAPGGVRDGFDLILCKNVLIYLTERACAQVSERLARMLAVGGTLLTGASDHFFDLPGLWERHTSPAGVTFTRVSRSSAVTVREPSPRATPLRPPVAVRERSAEPRWSEPGSERPAQRAMLRASPLPARPPARSKTALSLPTGEHAIDRCRAALRADPTSEPLHVELASLLIEQGRDSEAEVVLRTLLYLNAKLPLAHFLSGLVLRRLGEPRKAARAYRRAISLCEEQLESELVPCAEGVSYQGLASAAREQARMLDEAVHAR